MPTRKRKADKESLDSYRAESDKLTKQNSADLKSAEESNTNNSCEPLKKKRKTGKQSKSGTIIKSAKVADLKEEAIARGVEVTEASRMIKSDLLNFLGVGST